MSDKNKAPDTTASALGPFTQMAAAIDAAEHAHFMRRLSSGKIEGWGTVTYGRSTPFAFPDNVTPVAAIVSPPRPFRLYGGVSIEATTASASADAGLLYCHVCTNHRQASCGDKDCGIDSRAAQPVQAGVAVDLPPLLKYGIGLSHDYVAGYNQAIDDAHASLAPVAAQQGAAEAKRTIDTEAFRSVLGAYVGALEAQETRRKIEDHYRSIVLFVDSQLSAAKAPAAQTVDARDIDNLDLPDFWKLVRKYANAGGDTRITAGQALLDHIEQWHDSSDNQPNASIVAQDAAALAWQHALESAAFYVAGHCANGDHHAKIIMMMPAPTITINVDAARRFRAQGGNANDSSANLAATTAGAATTSEDAPSVKQEKLRALADRIDHESLWKRPMMCRGQMTDEQRDRLDAGVMLRRYSDLLAPGRWLVVPPTGSVQFSAASLDKVTEMAKADQDRKAMRATQQEGGK